MRAEVDDFDASPSRGGLPTFGVVVLAAALAVIVFVLLAVVIVVMHRRNSQPAAYVAQE